MKAQKVFSEKISRKHFKSQLWSAEDPNVLSFTTQTHLKLKVLLPQ